VVEGAFPLADEIAILVIGVSTLEAPLMVNDPLMGNEMLVPPVCVKSMSNDPDQGMVAASV
jgi:hypothetical protein